MTTFNTLVEKGVCPFLEHPVFFKEIHSLYCTNFYTELLTHVSFSILETWNYFEGRIK